VGNSKQAAAGQAREGDEQAGIPLERIRDPSRVLALSDGVFAIIMTLLVLDIRVPQLAEGGSLTAALRQLRPSLTAFVISFIVAGMYWVGHRDLFGLIRRADRGLVWLNLVYLLPLCLLPFGTGLLGRYDREPAALRIYGLILFAIAVMRVAIWLYATSRPHLLWQQLDHRQRRAGLALTLTPGLIFLLAVLFAAAAPGVSLVIYGVMPVLYFTGVTVLRGSRRRNKEYADFS
jgi:uncharacterized membrane protein